MAEKYFKVYPEHYPDYSSFKNNVVNLYLTYHIRERGGDKSKTAKDLGINRVTIFNNCKQNTQLEILVENSSNLISNYYGLPLKTKPITLPNLEDKDEEYKYLANLYVGYFDESYIHTVGDIKIIKELAARFRSYGESEYEKAEDLEDLVEVVMKEWA